VKPLTLLFIATAAAVSACAPMPTGPQVVGTSQQTPEVVGKCIAQKWANRSQTPVMSQLALANYQAVDVYAPGQQPPSGTAALVRPSTSANNKTWVGMRGSAGPEADADIKACL
jgi:hypothetical protein